MTDQKIPNAVIAEVSNALAANYYSHSKINILFSRCGVPGEPPGGNLIDKCSEWLRRGHDDQSVDALALLGCVIEDFMDKDWSEGTPEFKNRERVIVALEKFGLSYSSGGKILGGSSGTPTSSLEKFIRDRDLNALEKEFQRALNTVNSDPPAAVTAACSIIESLCKIYIEDNGLTMPSDQSVKSLFREVQRHLGLHPGSLEDRDISRVLGGLASVVDGVGALRTHAGSAHGRGRSPFHLTPRHARLAIHSANTIVFFVLETWDESRNLS